MNGLLVIAQIFFLVSLIGYVWLLITAFKRSVGWGFGVLLFSPLSAIIFGLKYWYQAKKPFLVYMVPLIIAVSLSFKVFVSMGGMEMIGAAKQVAMGISKGELSKEDAMKFMHSGINVMENSSSDPKEKKKAVLMRRMMMAMESKGSEEDRRKLDDAFRDLLADETLTPKERRDLYRLREKMKLGPLKPSEPVQTQAKRAKNNHRVASKPATEASFPARNTPPKPNQVPLTEAKNHIGRYVILTDNRGVEHEGRLTNVSGDTHWIEKRTYGGALKLSLESDQIRSLQVQR